MYDLWVEVIKTKETWRVDHDSTKMCYLDSDGQIVFNCDIGDIKFYPCCPKEAPKNETIETGDQLSIFDYMKGAGYESG